MSSEVGAEAGRRGQADCSVLLRIAVEIPPVAVQMCCCPDVSAIGFGDGEGAQLLRGLGVDRIRRDDGGPEFTRLCGETCCAAWTVEDVSVEVGFGECEDC